MLPVTPRNKDPDRLSWEAALAEFRALGGTAENVERRAGPFGFGLFPIDPARSVMLHVPTSMFVPCRAVHQEGDDLVVSDRGDLAPGVADFFTRYAHAFSWGTDAPAHVESFAGQLAQFPQDIRQELDRLGLALGKFMDPIATPVERFMETRAIFLGGEAHLMPVAELLNHSPYGPFFDARDGVRVTGTFADEVLINYGLSDSLHRFFGHQFISDEAQAFSLPICLPLAGDRTLTVTCALHEGKATVGPFRLPIRRDDGDHVTLSHLMLGNERWPRVPRTIFRHCLPEFAAGQADELFQRIVSANMLSLLGLSEVLEGHDSPMVRQLRSVVRLQLKGIAQSYGARNDCDDLFRQPALEKA